jgi:hypothetical protein
VYMSRKLVAPEVYHAVHDALRLNGAEVLPCSDPDRTGPLDYHVISSSSHVRSPFHPHPPSPRRAAAVTGSLNATLPSVLQERFEDLRAKGCNLLGKRAADLLHQFAVGALISACTCKL